MCCCCCHATHVDVGQCVRDKFPFVEYTSFIAWQTSNVIFKWSISWLVKLVCRYCYKLFGGWIDERFRWLLERSEWILFEAQRSGHRHDGGGHCGPAFFSSLIRSYVALELNDYKIERCCRRAGNCRAGHCFSLNFNAECQGLSCA